MSRSTCLVTLPRSGSEVLLHYLAAARNLELGGEFLSLNTPDYPVAKRVNTTGVFLSDWTISKISSTEPRESFVRKEFASRLDIVESHRYAHRPLVVKNFSNTFMYGYTPFDALCELFDIVILGRKNKFYSILSYFICRQTGIWHEGNLRLVAEKKAKISATKFTIDEAMFFRQVQVQNFHTHLQNNIQKFKKDAVSVYYEDFADDPINKLNHIFGHKIESGVMFNKLIDDHESHIENIDRLRDIYNKYILD